MSLKGSTVGRPPSRSDRDGASAVGHPLSRSDRSVRSVGRPVGRVFLAEEVAGLLSHSAERVVRALELAAGSFFPHAWKDKEDGVWRIPEGDVRRLLGPGLPRLFPVPEFAELIGYSADYVYELVELGVVPHRKVLGHIRISADTYFGLPAERPAAVRARPSFFARNKGDGEINNGDGVMNKVRGTDKGVVA